MPSRSIPALPVRRTAIIVCTLSAPARIRRTAAPRAASPSVLKWRCFCVPVLDLFHVAVREELLEFLTIDARYIHGSPQLMGASSNDHIAAFRHLADAHFAFHGPVLLSNTRSISPRR